MKLGILIFTRFSSKRLKGKIFKKINNTLILDIIYKRIKKTSGNLPVIVTTTNRSSDEVIAKYCKKKKIKCFRGSYSNILDRAKKCCKKYKLDSFVRICGDRPFIDYDLLKKMIKKFSSNNYDIVTNTFPKTYPYGLTCEIIKISSIQKIKKNKLLKSDKEHILDYFYRNHKSFKIKNFYSKKKKNKNLNLSLDTLKDFKNIKKIFKNKNYNFTIKTFDAIQEFKKLSI
tara:strand:- start:2810 stop:3496 length:687 start_codon:yes stop_codon:yes gene_type:complete